MALLRLERRAEIADAEKLIATFVDSGLIVAMLSSKDHQIIYGRRGTGKTHALKYLYDVKKKIGDISIYIDLRTIGSNGSIYANGSMPVVERATRLILDVLSFFHDALMAEVFHNEKKFVDFNKAMKALESIENAIMNAGTARRQSSEQSVELKREK